MYRINCELEEYLIRRAIRRHWNFVPRLTTSEAPSGNRRLLDDGCILSPERLFLPYSERRYRNLWIRDWILKRSLLADEVCISPEKERRLLLAVNLNSSAEGTPTSFHSNAWRCCSKGLLIFSACWLLLANAIANTPESRSTGQVRNPNNES